MRTFHEDTVVNRVVWICMMGTLSPLALIELSDSVMLHTDGI